MIKAELVRRISKDTGVELIDVSEVLESFFKSVKEVMISGEGINIRQFGNFILKNKKEKRGRNIHAGTFVIIPEHYTPIFKPSKSFVNSVKNNVKQINMKTEIVGELTQETTIREFLISYVLKMHCMSDKHAETVVDSYLGIKGIFNDTPITIKFSNDQIMREWFIRNFTVISTEEAEKRNLIFVGNVHGDEINKLNCRSIWIDLKRRSYRVRELY